MRLIVLCILVLAIDEVIAGGKKIRVGSNSNAAKKVPVAAKATNHHITGNGNAVIKSVSINIVGNGDAAIGSSTTNMVGDNNHAIGTKKTNIIGA